MFSEKFNKKAITSRIRSDKLKHRFNNLLKNFPKINTLRILDLTEKLREWFSTLRFVL